MLWAAAILLIALWGLGLASGAALGSWVHLLLGLGLLALALAAARSFSHHTARAPPGL